MADSNRPGGLGIDANKLAILFGVSDREVRDLAARGIIVKLRRGEYDLAASVKGYCTHLREQAAGRRGTQGLDNVSENALLTRERRQKLKQDAEKDAGKLIPIETVIAIMVDHITGVKAMVLGIPNEVQSECPHLDMADLKKIRHIVEGILRNNAERAIQLDGLHPEITQYIRELQGRGLA